MLTDDPVPRRDKAREAAQGGKGPFPLVRVPEAARGRQ